MIGFSKLWPFIPLASNGEGDSLLAYVGEVIVLLTMEGLFGMAKDSEAGLAMLVVYKSSFGLEKLFLFCRLHAC